MSEGNGNGCLVPMIPMDPPAEKKAVGRPKLAYDWRPSTLAGRKLLHAARKFSTNEVTAIVRETYRIAMSDDPDRLGHKKVIFDLWKWGEGFSTNQQLSQQVNVVVLNGELKKEAVESLREGVDL